MTEAKKKVKNLIGFLSTNKINNYNIGEKKEKKNPDDSTEQIKK